MDRCTRSDEAAGGSREPLCHHPPVDILHQLAGDTVERIGQLKHAQRDDWDTGADELRGSPAVDAPELSRATR